MASELVFFAKLIVDGVLILAGLAIAGLMLESYKKLGSGPMTVFARHLAWGIVFFGLALVTDILIGEGTLFFKEFTSFSPIAVWALLSAGFGFLVLGGWELYRLSAKKNSFA